MRQAILFALIVLAWGLAEAADFECQTEAGVYRPPGSVEIDDAATRDPTVIGQTFYVTRESGSIVGRAVLDNDSDHVQVVLDTPKNYEVISKSQDTYTSVLSIDEFQGKWTFKYYLSWLGLLLTGTCTST